VVPLPTEKKSYCVQPRTNTLNRSNHGMTNALDQLERKVCKPISKYRTENNLRDSKSENKKISIETWDDDNSL